MTDHHEGIVPEWMNMNASPSNSRPTGDTSGRSLTGRSTPRPDGRRLPTRSACPPHGARQLASRGRGRVRGTATVSTTELTRQREVVEAFLAASREGSFDALLAVLDPDIVFRTDPILVSAGASEEIRGAASVARQFTG